jgi:hypothetical protein
VVKRIWDLLGDIRISFVLLMIASATLFTGSIYAGGHFSLFGEMNRLRVQDWLAVHIKAQPELSWWIPMLFVIMGALGLNTFICASSRIARLIPQRRALSPGKFFFLLIPSLIHFLFIIIMLGHLTTFSSAKWQTIQLKTGTSVALDGKNTLFEVQSIQDLLFPETSGLRNRISQTTVTLKNVNGNEIKLQYLQPVLIDGRFLFLDKIKEGKKAPIEILPREDKETCNKAPVYMVKMKAKQLLLIVSDPGFYIIICGLTLIMCLMIWYYLIHEDSGETH